MLNYIDNNMEHYTLKGKLVSLHSMQNFIFGTCGVVTGGQLW